MPPADAINVVNELVVRGFYCSIHGSHHAYDEQAIRKTLSNLAAASAQISTRSGTDHKLAIPQIGVIATHWLQLHQSEECAKKFLWGEANIPEILYKYIPRELICKGTPDSLRATQLLALNDDMECNVTTMRGREEEDTLAFLAVVKTRLERRLGIAVPWEELLTRSLDYGDIRLSTFIQEYLNPLVGVVSFSTDKLVPTMWAHYARNTGIVVGYDTEALRALGFELRPVVYSELAPRYQPQKGDAIRLDFVNREDMDQELKAGRNKEGFPILASTYLAEFGADWKSLSRLMLVERHVVGVRERGPAAGRSGANPRYRQEGRERLAHQGNRPSPGGGKGNLLSREHPGRRRRTSRSTSPRGEQEGVIRWAYIVPRFQDAEDYRYEVLTWCFHEAVVDIGKSFRPF